MPATKTRLESMERLATTAATAAERKAVSTAPLEFQARQAPPGPPPGQLPQLAAAAGDASGMTST